MTTPPRRTRPSLSRLLLHAQTGQLPDARPHLAARLLSSSPPLHCHPSQSPANRPAVLEDCFTTVRPHHQTITLHVYPPAHAYLHKSRNPVTHTHYRPSDGTLAYAWTTRWHRSGLMLLRLPFLHAPRQEVAWIMDAPRVACLAVAPQGARVAAGQADCTRVYHAREFDHRMKMRGELAHADGERGSAVAFMHVNEVVAGTEGGMVYRWDLREFQSRAAGGFRAGKGKGAVCGVRGGRREREVYVGVEGQGVAVWDVRAGLAQGPCRVFEGREQEGRFDFDFVEGGEGGLLAATEGDCVRLWDCERAARMLDTAYFRGQLTQRVKFAGWGASEEERRPGVWVETDKGLYVVRLGSPNGWSVPDWLETEAYSDC